MRLTYEGAFADFFSAGNMERLAWYGRSDVTDHCLALASDAGLLDRTSPSLRDLADALFEGLRRHCRVEYLFKSVALQRVLYGRHSPHTTAFFFELPIGDARADIVVVNGTGRVLEIKTSRDDLSRLEQQLSEYSSCFGEVAVFVEAPSAQAVLDATADNVGVVSLSARNFMSWHRMPSETHQGFQHEQLFRLLRKGEVPRLLAELGLREPDTDPMYWWSACLERFHEVPVVSGAKCVHAVLKRRPDTRKRDAACQGLPKSIWALVFGARIAPKDWTTLRSRMDLPYGA